MKIVLYNSVDGSAYMRRLVEQWRDAGYSVEGHYEVTESEYRARYSMAGRIWLRWRMYGKYSWSSWWLAKVGCRNPKIQVATTNPFFLPALVARAGGMHVPTINVLYDHYPEALIMAGVLRRGSWTSSVCTSITKFALRESAVTVFLGDRLKAFSDASYGPPRKSRIIHVGADGVPFRNHPPIASHCGAKPTILYCGQMGRMHDIKTVIDVLTLGSARRFTWRFHGSGHSYGKFRNAAQNLSDVTCGESLSDHDWQGAMRDASIALVTVARGAEKVVMPSKTYSALVAGQAVLAICVRESDLADLVLEHDCGWVVEPGDTAGLAALLERLAANPAEILAKRCCAYRVGHDRYDMTPIARQWLALFRELESI